MGLFLELIQVALGNRDVLSKTPADDEWVELFAMSQKQAVVGVAFDALDHLAKRGQKLPSNLLFEWIGLTEQIQQQNHLVNKRCGDIVRLFLDAGFKCCILKGQGNAIMYPEPLLRQSGDIDVWVDATKEQIESFVHKMFPEAEETSHHIDYPVFDDVNVEVHFTPTYSVLRRYQRELEKIIEVKKINQFNNPVLLADNKEMINVPTDEFNIVYQLSHMQRHFFYGGLGLRQVIDFYYLLKKVNGKVDIDKIKKEIKSLGLSRYASAVMWLLKNVLLMEDKYLICLPDEKRGKLLFDEIMKSGNFGQYDRRLSQKAMKKSATLSILIRNLGLIRLFPEEAILAPIDGLIRQFAIKN